jgi:hypothetical protein
VGKASRERANRKAREAARRSRHDVEVANAEEQGWPVKALTERDCTVIVRCPGDDDADEKPVVLEGVLISWDTPSPSDSPTIDARVRISRREP